MTVSRSMDWTTREEPRPAALRWVVRDPLPRRTHRVGLEAAVLTGFDAGTYTATFWFEAAESASYGGVAVSRGCPAASMVAGARILVWAPGGSMARWIVVAVV